MLRSVQTLSVRIILWRALQNQVKCFVGRGSENFFVFHRFCYISLQLSIHPSFLNPLNSISSILFYSVLFHCRHFLVQPYTTHPLYSKSYGGIVVAACILVVSTVHFASQPISCILEICKTFF